MPSLIQQRKFTKIFRMEVWILMQQSQECSTNHWQAGQQTHCTQISRQIRINVPANLLNILIREQGEWISSIGYRRKHDLFSINGTKHWLSLTCTCRYQMWYKYLYCSKREMMRNGCPHWQYHLIISISKEDAVTHYFWWKIFMFCVRKSTMVQY